MGTCEFAARILSKLTEHHSVVAVFTQKERALSPVHMLAQSLNINLHTPDSLANSLPLMQSLNADVGVVASYGMLIPQVLLSHMTYLNVHPSSLPMFRGSSPIQHTILAGIQTTAICVMKLDAGCDTGPIMMKSVFDVPNKVRYPELRDMCAEIGSDLLLRTLACIESIEPTPQVGEPSYAHKLSRNDGLIIWSDDVELIERKIRAFDPWPGTFFYHHNQQIKILDAQSVVCDHFEQYGMFSLQEGAVFCNRGKLIIKRIQKAGGKAMDFASFLRGYVICDKEIL